MFLSFLCATDSQGSSQGVVPELSIACVVQRLEPNNQLYEGVRYIFINVTDPGSSPWSIENFRVSSHAIPRIDP